MPTTNRSLPKRLWYRGLKRLCELTGVVAFRYRFFGRRHEPATGGVMVVSNHQSLFDPVLVGMAFHRQLNYLARDSLFGFAPFRWLCFSLDAIPLDREGLGLAGIKETLRRLKGGELVLIFPEGTRTRTGEIGPFKPGFCALVRRSRVPIVPVALDGAFEAWPKTQTLPWRADIHVRLGPPVTWEQYQHLDDDELLQLVESRVRECFAQVRGQRVLV